MSEAVFDLCVFDEVAFDEAGGLVITPSPASAIGSVVAPTVIHGSVSITPSAIQAVASVVAPTVVEVPTAITQAASNKGGATARINGKITDDGGESCEARFRYRKKGTAIEVGSPAIDRAAVCSISSASFVQTHIDYNNPANAAGELDTVEIYIHYAVGGNCLRLGTFQDNGSGNFTCHDGLEIGEVPSAGYHKYTGLSLAINEGEYLGCDGKQVGVDLSVDRTSAGGGGVYFKTGARCDPEDTETYVLMSGDIFSLRGIGNTESWIYSEWQNALETDGEYHKDLTELDPVTEYEFQTQAKNSAGESEWSESAYFETLSGIIISPTPAQAVGSVVAPTVILGSTLAIPEPIDALAQVIQPQVKAGNIIFAPAPIDAIAKAVSPTVIYGVIIPDPISAIASGANPVIVLTSISITPTYIEAIGQVVAPNVSTAGVVYVTPDAIDAIAAGVNPTVILGSITLTPDALSAIAQVALGKVKQGNIILGPDFAKALGKAVSPTVIGGDLILEPESIEAIARGENPEVILASMTITPEFVKALAGVIAPTVLQTWIGRKLRLVIVTTQNRKVNVITSQYRKVDIVTTQKRKVRVITGE